MKNILVIGMKELRSYFYSPLAYVILCVFSIISGNFFKTIIFQTQNSNSWISFSGGLSTMLMIFIPLLTMRLFSEENRSGTFELLLSYPLNSAQLVIGKFLGAMMFSIIMFLPTLIYVSFLYMYSIPDTNLILSSYLGMFLLTMAFVSVGIFSSALTKSQVVASITGFGILLFMWAIHWLKDNLSYSLGKVLAYISIAQNYSYFAKGILDTRAVIFLLSIPVFMLIITIKLIEDKRYRS
ncbi:MAG: hypothetical protein C0601_01845 [Candidatus Muiribacterium halophilum]|uniref:ABC transporter permease n=1 Tax=Muiribacterium halophilum TaxID=2053465 RepID=A0A2N5ZLA5_MUIH1|nr:MAG: hypothetical protein C0601_01845 [Candidatus Muirbacterium halophilum]